MTGLGFHLPPRDRRLPGGGRNGLACHALLLAALLLSVRPRVLIAQKTADEAGIRAAMVINIARFTDWPTWKMDAQHPEFLICILGSDPIDPYADKLLDHQTVQDKPTVLRRVKPGDSLESCHLLYASVANRKWLQHTQPELQRGAVLTISELSNDSNGAQILGLPTDGDHVRIEINLNLAEKSKLRISARILRLATVTQ